ncbi:unnamed protein product [Blepharisma stoltei]|uniref:tRNA nucleotidyltransferase n=1 Tax=Blepharisma stoltei TaxID=1481888 RepID=A0AAU9IQX5_9CILI|nr:unnamed protein product [Blepharisma stoltei]
MEPSVSVKIPAEGIINLTPIERQLFDELLRVVEVTHCNTVLRVAGGWVRDKILGLHSDDIDIALDNMMGEDFANLIKQHIHQSSSIGKIKANSEASKHLETACVRIMGLELDIVNLRSEDYTEVSRIPSIRIGTPEEDAFRRDLTINSMFYNLHENVIEDYTRRGMQDLQNKIARTPLPHFQTFLDDPLRILRTVRFAARFNLEIDPEIEQSVRDDSIITALNTKVSRERISKEYTLMVRGKNPHLALEILHSYNLLPIIFKVPSPFESQHEAGYELARTLKQDQDDLNYYSYTTAMLTPYKNANHYKVERKKGHFIPLYEYVLLESLKFSNADTKIICNVLAWIDRTLEILENFDVIEAAYMIKENKEFCTMVIEIAAHIKAKSIDQDLVVEAVEKVHKQIHDNRLGEFWKEKPLLTGADAKKYFRVNGVEIGKLLEDVLKWQILNRNGSKEEVIEVLKLSYEFISD